MTVLWWLYCGWASRPFWRSLHSSQGRLLKSYIERNAATAFGRRHGFSRIQSIRDYQSAVPIRDYDGHASYIERVAAGETSVLTASPVRMLELSSGSTRASKMIPYTDELKDEFNRGLQPWIWDLYRRYPAALGGCAYWSISPMAHERQRSAGGIPIGFNTDAEYLSPLQRHLTQRMLAVPGSVARLRDIETARYATLFWLLRRADLRLISVWHPSFMTILLERMRRWWDDLVEDIYDGHLRVTGERTAPMRRWARRLTPTRVWPELKVLSCWADGPAAGPAADLLQRLPQAALQAKGLLSTEAFVTLPVASLHLLAVRSHFFEVLADDGTVHLPFEVEPGQEYQVVVTTGGGLYRYNLHDRVRITGRVGMTPSLRFVGKTDRVSDMFGEKLNESFVAGVLQRLGVHARFAMLAPNGSHYTLYIDGASPPARALDEALRTNFHYDYCRKLGQLEAARVFAVGAAASEIYIQTMIERGQKAGDVKPTALSTLPIWSERFKGEYV